MTRRLQGERAGVAANGRLGLAIEHLSRARFPGFFGVLEDFLLHADHFANLVDDVHKAFPL